MPHDVYTVLQKTTAAYEEKQRTSSATEKVMFPLIWDIEELKRLNTEGRKLRTEILTALDVLCMPEAVQREHNLCRKLGLIRTGMRDVVKGLYRFKRTPATHMFVFMISSALRDRKPYALPIQCVPYTGLKESDMRRMVNCIIKEMIRHGMTVAGKRTHDIAVMIILYIHVYIYIYIYILFFFYIIMFTYCIE